MSETWDDTFGGREFDLVLANLIAQKFNALKERRGKEDVRNIPAAMEKIINKIVKPKAILSANKETKIYIENLYDNIDFKVNFLFKMLYVLCF